MHDESKLTVYKVGLENPECNDRSGDQSVDKLMILTLQGMVSAVQVIVKI